MATKKKDLREAMFQYLEAYGVSINTLSSYQLSLEYFFEFFPSAIETVTTPDIIKFREWLRTTKNFSVSTINHHVTVVQRFVNYLKDRHKMHFDDDLTFKKDPVQGKEFLDYVLTKSDIERLIRATKRHDDIEAEAIITTLAYTGVRVHELLKIPTTAATLKRLEIQGKGQKTRTVFVTSDVRKAWKKHLASRGYEHEYIFPLSRSTIHRILKYYAGQARLKKEKIHAHAFRHFCGKYLHDVEGYSLAQVMAILGHRNPETTAIYTKPTREEIEKMMQQAFKGPKKPVKKAVNPKKRPRRVRKQQPSKE